MTARPDWDADEASEIIARHRDLEGAMLPILHALQDRFGHLDERAVPLVADALNLSRAEVHGVISFYHDFRRTPPGRHVLRVCRAEACQSMGGEALIEHITRRLDIELGETLPTRSLTVEAVYCLGNCACSPAVMMDGRLYGRVDAGKVDRLIDQAEGA
jgi:formate dehydrogenase subunit gamma